MEGEDELLVRLAAQLPEAARHAKLPAGKKSYTLNFEGAKIAVLLKREAFVITAPTAIPPELQDTYGFNGAGDVHVSWHHDAYKAWDDVACIVRFSDL